MAWRWTALLCLAAGGQSKEEPRLAAYPGAFCCTEALKEGFLEKTTEGTQGWWPEQCDWQRGIFGFEPRPFPRPEEAQFVKTTFHKACEAWHRVVGHGQRLTSRTPLPASGFERQLIQETLPFFPYGDMAWVQFAALVLQHDICVRWNGDDSTIGKKLCTGLGSSVCDCLAVVRENVRLIFSGVPARGADPSDYVSRLLYTFGAWRLNPQATEFQEQLGIHARKEVWGRFVLRQNNSEPGPGAAEGQRVWATAMAEQAFRLAELLRRQPGAAELLDFAGKARGQVKSPTGKNFNWGGRRTGQYVKSIITPFVGHSMYPGLWRKTLQNRIARGRPPFFTPDGEEADRSYVCAATVTSVDMPWRDCDAIIRSLGANVSAVDDDRVAGISREGDRCRVVLNRAIAVSPLDGYLIGEECEKWYGISQLILGLPTSYRILPMMYHSAPLAVDIMQQTLFQQELHNFYRHRAELWSHQACRRPDLKRLKFVVAHPAWRALLRSVATLYWYFLNMMPYERGTSTTGVLLHHALLMSVFEQKKQQAIALLACVPLFRDQAYPDWEALGNPLEEFVADAYPALFEKRLDPRCFHTKLFDKENMQW